MALPEDAPTREKVERYAYLSPMLDSYLDEMREFAKKKQDGMVNATKIKMINRILVDLKDILEKEKSAAYLDLLSESGLPQNSDAVLVLGQYRAALKSFEERHYRYATGGQRWFTVEYLAEREAAKTEDEDDDVFGDGDDEDDDP
jgi:hypothetical protein